MHTHRYVVDEATPAASTGAEGGGAQLCTEALTELHGRFDAQSARLEKIRQERLPGR